MTNAEQFKKDGYTVYENVLNNTEMTIFRNECQKIVSIPQNLEMGDGKHVRNNVLERSEIIRDLFLQNKISDKIKEICGDNFCILPEITVMQSQFGGWHKDTTSIELFGKSFHKNENFNVVNVAIYCQDNAENGGGLDVVPQSHKTQDSFVEFYKNQEKVQRNTNIFVKNIKKIKIKLKNLLHKLILKEEPFPFPLSVQDTRHGRFTIPSKKGDIIIFDLRLDHKASWPRAKYDFLNSPAKFAFFAICGRNNKETASYREYLNLRAKSQSAYNYLLSYNPSEELIKKANNLNLKII